MFTPLKILLFWWQFFALKIPKKSSIFWGFFGPKKCHIAICLGCLFFSTNYKQKDGIKRSRFIYPHLTFTKLRPTRPELVNMQVCKFRITVKKIYFDLSSPHRYCSITKYLLSDHATTTSAKPLSEVFPHGLVEQRQPAP